MRNRKRKRPTKKGGPLLDRRGVRHYFHRAADLIPGLSPLDIVQVSQICKPKLKGGLMDLVDFISEERLKAYEIHTDSRKKAVALHNHTLQLGSSLMSMIALMELSLRNVTNHQLIIDFEDEGWLLPGHAALPLEPDDIRMISSAQSNARKAGYSKLSYREKSNLDGTAFPNGVPSGMKHKNVVRVRQAQLTVTHGQVISQTTIAFWKRLYSSTYEDRIWKPSLKKVFPNKKIKRSQISRNLESIYATRNRVAHHEPVYGQRLQEVMDAINFVRNTFGARENDEETTFKKFSRVQHLRLRMDFESFEEAWNTLT
jgi:hypothetical protein